MRDIKTKQKIQAIKTKDTKGEYSGVAEPVIPVNRATTIPVARASRSRKKSHAFILITSI